jgi:uncharacterized damage-inducible protein DinB
MPIEPDTKDWTWVLDQPCPDCGFDAEAVAVGELAPLTRDNVSAWLRALDQPDAATRPTPDVWSALEYACHVRDVHRIFAGRLDQMLADDDPLFANWDQDAAALEGRYAEQEATEVADGLAQAAEAVAQIYDSVAADQWLRRGRRSNGSAFTVASLGRYHLHDVIHHTYDVSGGPSPVNSGSPRDSAT